MSMSCQGKNMVGFNRGIFTKGTVTYRDFDISFKSNPYSGDIRTKEDVEAIKQALSNLLFTNFGERPFRPLLGGGLDGLLFEPLDPITSLELDSAIRVLVDNWEPRVRIISLEVKDNTDQNSLEITLVFNVINISEPQTINVILKRIR